MKTVRFTGEKEMLIGIFLLFQEDGIELEVFDDGDYNRLRLKITNVRRSHDGLYFCKASNAAGVAEKTGHLQVQCKNHF